MSLEPKIGRHLATLNLFREEDGRIFITVAEAKGAIRELDEKGKLGVTIPLDYVHSLLRGAENL